MRSLIYILIALVWFTLPVSAWKYGNPAPGKMTMDIGGNDLGPLNFINILKAGNLQLNSYSPADGGKMDQFGYFTSTPTNSVGIGFRNGSWVGVQHKLIWPATVQFKMIISVTASGCTTTGTASITGCSNSAITVTSGGGAGSVTFTLVSGDYSVTIPNSGTFSHSAGEIALYRVSDEAAYNAGQYFTPEFIQVLKNLHPRNVRPMGWVNTYGANANFETNWAYRITPTFFTWKNGDGYVMPGLWASGGQITGTDTYTVPAAPDSPADWTDGEQIQAVLLNTNTSTTPTLQIASRTPKTIVKNNAAAMTASAMKAGQIATFIYDAVLDQVLYTPGNGVGGGIYGSIPIEAQVQLANLIGANFWGTVPMMARDGYVQSWASYIYANLRSDLYFLPEYSNEVWNQAFTVTNFANARGLALGFPATLYADRPAFSYYALRVRQIMGNLIPPIWSGRSDKLRRTLMFQNAGNATEVKTYRLQGADLAMTGTSTGTGNSAFCTYTGGTWNGSSCSGGANYTSVGQRPVDMVESIGYAPYSFGENVCVVPESLGGTTGLCPVVSQASSYLPFYQALVNYWEVGDTSSAIAMIDGDIRQGQRNVQTVTASGTTFTTPLAHGFTANSTNVLFTVTGGTSYSGLVSGMLYQVASTPTSTTFTVKAYSGGAPSGSAINAGTSGSGTVSVGTSSTNTLPYLASVFYTLWEGVAANYDASRVTPLRVEHYEGNIEIGGLTSALCGTVGVTGVSNAQCAADIAAAITAWKNSPYGYSTQQAYYNQFMGLDANFPPTFGLMPHSKTPAQLVLMCDAYYAILSGTTCDPTNAPYQTYYGIQYYNRN